MLKRSDLLAVWLIVVAMSCGGPLAEDDSNGEDAESADDALTLAKPCTAAKRTEILSAATTARPNVVVNCSFAVGNATTTLTKRIIIEGAGASGVTFDCSGASLSPTLAGAPDTVNIRSVRLTDGTWSRPSNVTVKNCRIAGSVRISGMGLNGEAPYVNASSHSVGHTERVQAAAPTQIRLQNLTIVAAGRTPVYFAPGVTRSRLTGSDLSGWSNSVAVYLDAESAFNVLRGNSIHVDHPSKYREQVAVDGSAYNKIVANSFAALNHGGVFFYRNCGEAGTVRHQSPHHNEVVANVFYYNKFNGYSWGDFNGSPLGFGKIPSVWLGSRNLSNIFYSYCDDDSKYRLPETSAVNDDDFARNNVIAQNQVYKLSLSDMLRSDDSGNFMFFNEQVTASHPMVPGCAVFLPQKTTFLLSGQKLSTRTTTNRGSTYACLSNNLTVTPNP